MVKLYFKKLGLMFFYVFLVFFIYYIGFGLLKTIANFFELPIIKYGVLFGVPTAIILISIYRHRIEKNEFRRSYLESTDKEKLILKNELRYMLKFDDFLAEMYSFATIIFPFVIAIGVGSQAPWYADIIAGILVFGVFLGFLFVLDFAFLIIVHMKWRKDSSI